MSAALTLQAPAKVNLYLAVGAKGPGGLHRVESLVQPVDLCDTLTFARRPGALELRCSRPELEGPGNLVCRAWELLRRRCPGLGGALVTLEKRIPAQAGMGGGSADCAAALRGFNRLYGLGLGLPELAELGAALGSDVPACLVPHPTLGLGSGTRLRHLPSALESWLVVLAPGLGFSTAEMYARADRMPPGRVPPGAEAAVCALAAGDLPALCRALYNRFEETAPRQEVIAGLRHALLEQGALGAMMTGSGSCVYGLFAGEAAARRAGAALAGRHTAFVCRMLNRWENRDV